MATSSAVSAGDLATADQYNNLRTDVLATHDHDGTDGSATISATTFDGVATVSANWTFTGTITVGVDDTGKDVKFFGATSGNYMLWDESTDDLVIAGSSELYFYDAAGGEHIKSDGTDMTIYAGADLNLTAVTDINIPSNVGLTFGNDGEKIEGDGTDLTIEGNNINLTATADIVIPANIGITFGSGEKIEGDSTDLTITSGAKINLSATSDVVIPADVGITFGTGEKIEGDSTDLTITSGAKINLSATSDVVIPANVGITFGSGEKIEGDDTDLTVTSGAKINLTATSDVHIPKNVGIVFDDNASEKIESNNTDLTVNSGADINLTAIGDVNIPSGVGITFGDDGEKIEGDGTDMTISGNIVNISGTLAVGTNNLTFSDITLSRGAANRLDLATGDSLKIVNGDILFPADNQELQGGSGATTDSLGWAGGDLRLNTRQHIYLNVDSAAAHGQDAVIIGHNNTNTSATPVIRLDELGHIKIGGTANHGTTTGTSMVTIFNGTAPVGTISSGASIYVASGEMYTIDAAGNVGDPIS
jgi:hypothetical protein